MDVASSDDGTDNEARNMRKAEKEATKLEKVQGRAKKNGAQEVNCS